MSAWAASAPLFLAMISIAARDASIATSFTPATAGAESATATPHTAPGGALCGPLPSIALPGLAK
jgi:hypothetical protein